MTEDKLVDQKDAQTRLAKTGFATNISNGLLHFEKGPVRGSIQIHNQNVAEGEIEKIDARLLEDG